jgi:hypothetical protein
MKQVNKVQKLSLTYEAGWVKLACILPLPPLRRGLVVTILAAITVWGGPDLIHFVQLILNNI